MNGSLKNILKEIEIPDELGQRAAAGIAGAEKERRTVMKTKKVVIICVAAAALILLCAAGFPLLRGVGWGESAEPQFNDEGKITGVTQSIFDPASYRPNKMKYMIEEPTVDLDDPEAEIMTVFSELAALETSPFRFYDGEEEIEDIGAYRLEIGESINMVGPWSEFTLTRKDENTFVMLDSEDCGFTYYIYPLTGDTVMTLDFTPTGFFAPPENEVTTIENCAEGFTIKDGETAVLGAETATAKKGDRVRFTVKFKDPPEELIGKSMMIGFYLDPFDPIAETEGPAYQDVNTWIYPHDITVDEYETVLEYPLAYSGEYKFAMYNKYAGADIEVERVEATVVPADD